VDSKKDNKIKVLWFSDFVIKTGFSRVSHSIIEHLPKDKYDLSVLAVNYFGDPHPYPYKVYPARAKGEIYGVNRVNEICEVEKPDLIFLINDSWITKDYLEELKKVYKGKALPKIVTYIPVDAKDHDPEWYVNFDVVDQMVAYTDFGRDVITKAVPPLEGKVAVIPHGIDNKTFYKIDAPKEELKKSLYGNRADLVDSFIVFSGNRNQSRKRLDILLYGFELFSRDKPENVKLYMHCGIQDQHINVYKLAKRLGFAERLVITNRNNGVQQVPEERLNLIYNATDVGVNTGVGEGFGLTQIEHSITGAPQVVADHSALHELYEDCGLLIPTSYDVTLDHIMTTGRIVRPEDVAEKLEMLYCDEGLRHSLSLKGLQKFTQSKYSWSNISQQWDELFSSLL
jgi:D-inositol-3-phosphate glycosyltransferase